MDAVVFTGTTKKENMRVLNESVYLDWVGLLVSDYGQDVDLLNKINDLVDNLSVAEHMCYQCDIESDICSK